jgi:hypothetical protein
LKYCRTRGNLKSINSLHVLGQDASVGEISEENIDRMCDAMTAFNPVDESA